MRGFLIGVILGVLALGLPVIYIKIGKPKYTVSELKAKPPEVIEKEYREKVVSEINKKIEEFKENLTGADLSRVMKLLGELRQNLPVQKNNRVVSELKTELSKAGYERISQIISLVEKLEIKWVADPTKVREGKIIFKKMCMTCHGREGDSLPITPEGLRADLGYPIYARDFTGKYHREGKVVFKFASSFAGEFAADEDIKRIIREGLPGTPMPGFPDLSDRELSALIEYIKSLNPRWKFFRGKPREYPAPPTDLFDMARVEKGKALFSSVCVACHRNPEKGEKPIVQPTAWYEFDEKGRIKQKGNVPQFQMIPARDFVREPLRRGKPEYIFSTVKEGIAGTSMTPWKHLGDEKIWDLVAYILYLEGKRNFGASPVQNEGKVAKKN